jgi:hypothetical protein
VTYRSDIQLSKASSVWTTRTFRPDLPLCREASNCSSLHPSRSFSSTSGRLLVFDKLQDFFPKHSYGKFVATVRTTLSVRQASGFLSKTQLWEVRCNRPDNVDFRPDSLIHKVRIVFKSKRPNDSPHGPDPRPLDMGIVCIRSIVRTTIPLV